MAAATTARAPLQATRSPGKLPESPNVDPYKRTRRGSETGPGRSCTQRLMARIITQEPGADSLVTVEGNQPGMPENVQQLLLDLQSAFSSSEPVTPLHSKLAGGWRMVDARPRSMTARLLHSLCRLGVPARRAGSHR